MKCNFCIHKSVCSNYDIGKRCEHYHGRCEDCFYFTKKVYTDALNREHHYAVCDALDDQYSACGSDFCSRWIDKEG